MTHIPTAVAAVVNDVLQGSSHATLDELFQTSGAPGDPPSLSHAAKWKAWLMRCNSAEGVDPLFVLGKVLEELMEVEPPKEENVDSFLGITDNKYDDWKKKKHRVVSILESYGLKYIRGGKVAEVRKGSISKVLEEELVKGNYEEINVEFQRAVNAIDSDPGAAITAGCAILEALFKVYISEHGLTLPNKQTIKPLWNVVQKHIGFNPASQTDSDVQVILTGLSSIVDGIGALRTHGGSAHGGGELRYNMKPRHASLIVGTAHTLALFVIQTWQERE